MYKIFSILILLFFLNSCNENFTKLPEKETYDEELLKSIIPIKNVEYWQVDYVYGISPEKIFSNGNTELAKLIPIPEAKTGNGFFSGCQPSYCNYRILYLKNKNWYFVQSIEELREFIGKIDNEKEAFLIARINDYDIDYKSSKGNGFLKTNYGYKLKVNKYNSCPESKEAFIVSVQKDGKLSKFKDLGYYYKSKNCIVY
ncbi:hypothetical protein ACFOWU_08400 [Epilithonimonas zeae]|uniref:Uncharacterized protein n=1 Tax=Epilithonimonas zeae TaxID=1416779 RepID=A0A1N6GBG4_9FLAO|nr:hypothetical protein [Epilithonimonas zeae]SIO04865.1 hypothetical protein SAMN05444409_1754 [Epilithonimonas zeae]